MGSMEDDSKFQSIKIVSGDFSLGTQMYCNIISFYTLLHLSLPTSAHAIIHTDYWSHQKCRPPTRSDRCSVIGRRSSETVVTLCCQRPSSCIQSITENNHK